MKSTFIHRFFLAVAILCSILGCTKNKSSGQDTVVVIKQQQGKPLAQIGNSVLTVENLREDFQRRQGTFKGAPNLNTEKSRNDYVESQVLQEAMFLDAIEKGTLNKIDLQTDVKKLIVQRRVRDELEQAQSNFEPTEQSIKDHYEKNKQLYNRDDAVRVAFISVPFGENKVKAKEVASIIHKDALMKVKNANSRAFSRLAIDHADKVAAIGKVSIETNETEYLEKAAFEEKFGKDTFLSVKNLENVGEFLPLITTDKSYVVMMKSGARKALNETLEAARPKIIKRLAYEGRSEHYKKYTEGLKEKYKVKVYNELIAELSASTDTNKLAELPEKAGEKAAPEASNPTGTALPVKSSENPN